MRGLIGKALERRGMPSSGAGWSQDPSAIPPNSAYGQQLAGVVVSDQTALSLMTVMACVRLVSAMVSKLPLDSFMRTGTLRIPVEPEPTIVANPFGTISRREGLRMGVISLMLRGNAYYFVASRDRDGYPLQLQPIPPGIVKVKLVAGVAVYEVNNIRVSSDDIVHLRWVTLPGALVGMSPIEYAAQGLGIGLAAEEYGARFFSQGATLSGVLETEQNLQEGTARRLAKDFQNKHGGLAQAHLPLILDNGLTWKGIQVPPDQAQFLAAREFQRGEIAMLYGVPPHLIGDTEKSTSWGTGIEDQFLDFARVTLEDYTSIFEDAWNTMTPPDVRCKFNFDAMLRSNTVDRFNAYEVARTAGWMNNEEIRALEDMPPSGDPAMSSYSMPMNSMPKPSPSGAANTGGDVKAL